MIGVSFQTRARTIDHLGRGQIADLPTAITELWKNAYDAYATNVALHLFDGTPEVAAVFDDGRGMSRQDFTDRWLVIGTESKIVDKEVPREERFGLPDRARQGEKGIGRLSAAFIAPITLVVSKKPGGPFVATLVDWRLFENPFLSLSDIRLPLQEFVHPDDLERLLPEMFDVLRENVRGGVDPERRAHLATAWDRFTEEEDILCLSVKTKDSILGAGEPLPINRKHLEAWPTFIGLKDHGTALFMVGMQHGLSVWLRPDTNDEEVVQIKDRLRRTLTAFTDPLSEQSVPFVYEVIVHRSGHTIRVIGPSEVFGVGDFRTLEHQVTGQFDEDGVFEGRIVVFGKDRGVKQIPPRYPSPRGRAERLGPFAFCIGTFEFDPKKSTHTPDRYEILKAQAERFGGIYVYRDGLRVMPYGRSDADFLEVEARRNLHAGRYFWAHRRSFGRIAVTRNQNPNLRDKSGREGLVDNRARNALRDLVIDVLVEVAKRYYGTDAPVKREELSHIQKRNAAARAAAERARKSRRTDLRKFLNQQSKPLQAAIEQTETLRRDIDAVKGPESVTGVVARIRDLYTRKDQLRPPPAPTDKGDLEDRYREYRDGYRSLLANIEALGKAQADLEATFGAVNPAETLRKCFHRSQSLLTARLDGYLRRLDAQLDAVRTKWRQQADEDRSAFHKACRPLLDDDPATAGLSRLLNQVDAEYRECDETFSARYEPNIRALEQLTAGVDLEGALGYVEDDRVKLAEQVANLNAVAQLGITVEIIGHELETLDGEIRRNMMRLPEEVRRTQAFRLAYDSHAALTERLRFLSPMKIAGYRSREEISGAQIADYVKDFFDRTFKADRIDFIATAAFRAVKIVDLASRIYPVFVNLVNNACHWVTQSADRRIILDCLDGKVVVADSGPGVDPDDIERLFTLFFTRRRLGRGVGLYLAKANLSVANHRIRYAEPGDPQVLPGANFIILFRGVGDE